MAFAFAHIQSARPSKASNGHHPLSEELLNSLAHVFRFAKLWQTSGTYSLQTSSVTSAVVAPAVVICLNSLLNKRPTADE